MSYAVIFSKALRSAYNPKRQVGLGYEASQRFSE